MLFGVKTIEVKKQDNKLFWKLDINDLKARKIKFSFEKGLRGFFDESGYIDSDNLNIEEGKCYNVKKEIINGGRTTIYIVDCKMENTNFFLDTGGRIKLFYKNDSDYTLNAGYTASIELGISSPIAFIEKFREMDSKVVIDKLKKMCYTEGSLNHELLLGTIIKQLLQSYVNNCHVLYSTPTTYDVHTQSDEFQFLAKKQINKCLNPYGLACINFSFKFNTVDESDEIIKKFQEKETQIIGDALDEQTRAIRKEDQRDDRNFELEKERIRSRNGSSSRAKMEYCPYCKKSLKGLGKIAHCPFCGMYIGD